MTFDGGEQVSTGVGLANIRDRLAQAYGAAHRFETLDPPDGRFCRQYRNPAGTACQCALADDPAATVAA